MHTRLRQQRTLGDLRWPDFHDHNVDSLWWVKGTEPTEQARHVIALLLPTKKGSPQTSMPWAAQRMIHKGSKTPRRTCGPENAPNPLPLLPRSAYDQS